MRRACLLLGVALAITSSGPAGAVGEPSHAQADVQAAMKESDYAFCKKPHEPLSPEAQALCPHASAIPGCDGFATACARRDAPPPSFDLPSWLLGAVAWLVRWGGLFVKWVLLPGIFLLLLWLVFRALASLSRDSRLADPDQAPPPSAAGQPAAEIETTTDEGALLGRADDRARRREYAAALELYLAASLMALDKRGAVKVSKDRTNGEYVRACAEPDAKPGLRSLVREVDRVKFGREAPTEEGVERAGATARAIVRGLATVLAAIAFLGCGAPRGWTSAPRAGDDPAGGELLVDLLHRQGFRAEPLGASLASLPLPGPDERAPAVVVDTERTELDDETREHLVEWVEKGGSLVLAGLPRTWPKEFGIQPEDSTHPGHVTARRLLARGSGAADDADDKEGADDEEDDDSTPASSAGPIYATATERGELARGAGVRTGAGGERVAWFDDDTAYAVAAPHGKGWVVGIATDELLTNAALARPDNAAVLLAIVSNADREELKIAQLEDGVSPPSTPLAALERAGLGMGLWHALVAALVLFLAEGVRLARPVPEPPPVRRAFVEHVEAVGALYRRTGQGAHALAAYARFADHRLRARMPRGGSDVAAFLASRARLPLDLCQRVWARATRPEPLEPVGDELEVLKELSAVYSAAMEQDR